MKLEFQQDKNIKTCTRVLKDGIVVGAIHNMKLLFPGSEKEEEVEKMGFTYFHVVKGRRSQPFEDLDSCKEYTKLFLETEALKAKSSKNRDKTAEKHLFVNPFSKQKTLRN